MAAAMTSSPDYDAEAELTALLKEDEEFAEVFDNAVDVMARKQVFAVRRPAATLGGALLALARVVVVGVGIGLLASLGCLLFTLPTFRLQLQHKILLSYFVMSVVPLVLLAAVGLLGFGDDVARWLAP